MRSKWTVGQQVAAGFSVVLMVLVALGVFMVRSVWGMTSLGPQLGRSHGVRLALASLAGDLSRAEARSRGYVITGQEGFHERYQKSRVDIAADMKKLLELSAGMHEHQLEELRPLVAAKLAHIESVVATRREKGFEAAQVLESSGEGRHIQEQVNALVADLRKEEERIIEERSNEILGAMRFLLVGVGAAFLFALAFVILAAFVISRSLRERISEAISRVQSSSTELQAAATQQASGAREQASTTTEVSTTVQEVLVTARQIAGNAQQVTRVADETAGAARRGNETVERAQEAIDSVRRQVEVIVNHMLNLGKRSQEIGSILDIINELADQTNILSINATIESAGAGEHGRRFAAVAEEIRKLADRVGRSTQEVRALIDEVRTAANTTLMATEDGSKAVVHSARQFAEVAGNFRQIAELVRTNLDVARDIELSTQQQTTAVEQMSAAIVDVAQTARQTEDSSAQTLRTATELILLSRELNSLIESSAA